MNLPTKGLLLVSVPLLSQLVFLSVLVVTRADQAEAQELALHTTEVIAEAEKSQRLMVEAQMHMRGYALAPVATFAQSYDAVRREIPKTYANLSARVHDNPPQVERAREIEEVAGRFLVWMDQNMQIIAAGRAEEVRARVQSQEGAIFLQRVRRETKEFLNVERSLSQKRQDRLDRAMRVQNFALAAGGILALVSTVVLLVGFSRAISSRVGVLIDNTRRMTEGRELAARLKGKDELGELDNMFHRMAEAIRQKDQENELFVYSVSHDLRSPLVNLQGFSQELTMVLGDVRGLVAESELPEKTKQRAMKMIDRDAAEAVGFIQSAVTRLAAIIDALLRLSRAGRVEYRAQKNEVHAIVNRVVQAMNDTLARKKVEVAVGPLPICWGDPAAVEQIFANLIQNAANYLDPTRPGKIEVGATECADSPMTTFWVKDNGLGIPEAQQPKVFVAFQRLHPGAAPGEGIGLALVRRVVERHGGRIWLESTPGVGTTFFVDLPCSREGLPSEHKSVTPIPRKG